MKVKFHSNKNLSKTYQCLLLSIEFNLQDLCDFLFKIRDLNWLNDACCSTQNNNYYSPTQTSPFLALFFSMHRQFTPEKGHVGFLQHKFAASELVDALKIILKALACGFPNSDATVTALHTNPSHTKPRSSDRGKRNACDCD